MAISSTAKMVFGFAALAAVGIGVGLAANKPAAAAAPSSGPTPTGTTLKAGERYAIVVTTTGGTWPALDIATTQTGLDAIAPGVFHVVQVSPAFNAPAQVATYTVDVLKPFWVSAALKPLFGNGNPNAPIVITVTDLGPSPTAATGPTAPPPISTPPLPPAVSTPPPVSTPPVGVPPIMPPATDVQTGQNRTWLASGTATYVPMTQAGAPAGSRIRFTLTDDVYRAAVGVGFGPGGRLGFANFVGSSGLVQQETGVPIFVWAPGDALPPDWPADDAHAADGWHVELLYRNASLVLTPPMIPAGLGVHDAGVSSWIAQGQGPTKATGAGALSWTASSGTIQPGDHVRLSFAPADLYTIANAVGFTGAITGPSCTGFLLLVAQSGFDQVVTGGGANLLAWCADDLLPPDWPPTDDLGNYHLETRYQGSGPLAVASLPFPVAGAWIAQGVGA